MSERPTPETDAVATFRPNDTGYDDWTPAEFARRLERERDEAIRQRDETNRSSKYACDYNYEQKLKAERERDEARQKMADALQEVDLRTLDYERMKQERDEARELVKAYQDYTQLLGDEISDMASVAYVHGWRSNRYEQGKVLREKIKQLEEAK